MATSIRALLLPCVLCAPVWAQVDMLSAAEALHILDAVPEIAAASHRGECPTYSIAYPRPTFISVQVRAACAAGGGGGSSLIQNYVIDRRTGVVAVGLFGEGANATVSVGAVRAAAAEEIQTARARLLSEREAHCLAMTAARFATVGGVGRASLTRLATHERGSARYLASLDIGREERGTGSYTVDLARIVVRDDSTGFPVATEQTIKLSSMLLLAREGPLISPSDAVRIAGSVPSIAAKTSDGCHELVSGEAGPGGVVYVNIISHCSAASTGPQPIAAINLATGEISEAATRRAIRSAEADAVAHRLLGEITHRRTNAESAAEGACAAISQ